jgi:hypothetical protein
MRALAPTAGATLLTLMIGAGGCASGGAHHWDYDKPRLTAIKLDRDLRECRREAYRPFALAVFNRIDEEALNRCMERRGYTITPSTDAQGR